MGQKKKVSLASVMSLKSKILILDEPTANLDPKSKDEIITLINKLNKEGITIITATHDLSLLSKIADRVYVLNKKIIAKGQPREIFKNNSLLLENNLDAPDIYKLFIILEKMNFLIDKIPLNIQEACIELLKNIKYKFGEIRLYYNKNIINYIKNLFNNK